MPLILPSNSISAGGYEVANSCNFEFGSLHKSISSPSTNFTISVWVKLSNEYVATSTIGQRYFWTGGTGGGGSGAKWNDGNDGILDFYNEGVGHLQDGSNRKYRDPSSWYHWVWKCVGGTGTLYVNGSQNGSTFNMGAINNYGDFINIGRYSSGTTYAPMTMAEFVYLDGTSANPDSFGEYDEDSGIWKPIDVSGLSFGTNGFYLDFENSGALGQDANGGTTLTTTGTLSQLTDTPTNNYATLNPLASSSTPIFSQGNLFVNCNSLNSWNKGVPATIVMSSGAKWYWEIRNEDATYPNYIVPGFMNANYYSNLISGSGFPGNVYDSNNGFINNLQGSGSNTTYNIRRAGSTGTTISDSFLNGDIMSFAVDLVNRKAWLGKNGTWINSGDPVNGTNETWGTSDIDANTDYVPTMHYFYNAKGSINFGNPTYSANGYSDANGYGNMSYSVPSGFYILNSKNLAEFG